MQLVKLACVLRLVGEDIPLRKSTTKLQGHMTSLRKMSG